jgi:RNA polymerase sigma factor (sigma-70 family)
VPSPPVEPMQGRAIVALMSAEDQEFRDLLDAARSGSQEAAQALVDEYGSQIIRAVRRRLNRQMRSQFDSHDFVQNVWTSFFADATRLELFNSPAALAAYLMQMAENKVVDEVRKRMVWEKRNVKRERSIDDSRLLYGKGLRAPSPTPSQVVMADEAWDKIRRERPVHYRMFELRQAGKTFEQIADELGVNERTVRRALNGLLGEQAP